MEQPFSGWAKRNRESKLQQRRNSQRRQPCDTFIFYSDGALYECVTKDSGAPSVSASNKITSIDGFSIARSENRLHIECIYDREENVQDIVKGVVGLRS